MSTPAIAPEAPKKEFNWKRLFIKAAGFGAGFALMLAVLAGVGIWYWNRPKPPKPWNDQAIKAEFDYADAEVEGEKNTLVVFYTLENKTDFDYTISDTTEMKIGAQLERQNSFSVNNDGYVRSDLPLFVPAHGRVRYAVHLAYPYPEREDLNASPDESHDFKTRVAQFMTKEFTNLDGFTIYDERARFKIVFSGGWKKRASEPLRLSGKK